MAQGIILGTTAVMAAAATIGTVILFREYRRKHQPVMKFRDLYADNASAELDILIG